MADPQNDVVVAALNVDRSPPIGNSKGTCSSRNRLHVKVDNCPDEPINVIVVDAPSPSSPDPKFEDVHVASTPGVPQTIFSVIVPAGKMRRLHHVSVSLRMGSEWSLTVDGSPIAGGSTGPGSVDSHFPWPNSRSVPAGSTIELIVEATAGLPSARIAAHLQAEDI